ncbi:MAG: hypothetical protein A2269_04955 [Lentisphaerae bacterium RIFOXYA12_FULL_60_10]|nr:MAG: hypothetical protein A2269_04955 [Lentisphaerae bacterium RIFOXYA12_FULL_60_10]
MSTGTCPGVETTPIRPLVETTFARNAFCAVAWEAIWALGVPFCTIWTIVPAYLFYLDLPKTVVQLIMIGFSLTAGFQLFSTRLFHGPRRRLWLTINWMLFSACWVVYGLLARMGWNGLPRSFMTTCFVLTCIGLAVTMHLGIPAYAEMLVANIPLRKRGRLTAFRNLALGTFGLLGVLAATHCMRYFPEPHNFHYAMLIGGSIMLVSCTTLLGWKDHDACQSTPASSLRSPWSLARQLAGNMNFRVFLVFHMLLLTAQSLAPLLIGYGRDILDLPSSRITHFTAAYFFGPILSGLCLAPLADRYGFRLIGILSATAMSTAFLLPILFWNTLPAVLIAYLLYAATATLNTILVGNLGAELVPDVKPGMMVAIGNVLATPLGLLLAPMAGALVDHFGSSGYVGVFAAGITMSVIAILGYSLLVREPRTGQEIHVRIRAFPIR